LLLIALCQVLVQTCLLQPEKPVRQILVQESFYLLLFSTFCVAAAGYIINDYYDIKIDAINKPKRLVIGKSINRRQAILAHLLLSGIGIIVGVVINWRVGLINLVAALLLWGYSARLKKSLLIGNIVIGVLSAAMLLVVAVNVGIYNKAVWAYALFSFIISLIREIIKDMEDIKGDASFDCRTLPIVAGVRGAKWVLYALLLVFYLIVIAAMVYRHEDPFFSFYMIFFILLPGAFGVKAIIKADRRRDFNRISRWCKGMMLMGVFSMLLFR